MIKTSPIRTTLLTLSAFVLFGYSQNDSEVKSLKSQVEALNAGMDQYKPGFGSIMMDLQAHHSKLWFAGSNKNWELAEFQVHEIEEAIEDIEKFHGSRPDSKMIGILESAVEDVHTALGNKNLREFEITFMNLTNNCNSCHHASKVGFNVIKVPEKNTFNNQEFSPSL